MELFPLTLFANYGERCFLSLTKPNGFLEKFTPYPFHTDSLGAHCLTVEEYHGKHFHQVTDLLVHLIYAHAVSS